MRCFLPRHEMDIEIADWLCHGVYVRKSLRKEIVRKKMVQRVAVQPCLCHDCERNYEKDKTSIYSLVAAEAFLK